MLVVPFTSDYDQRFTTQLGDDKYVFDARWNERGQVWTADITRDADQVQLIAGVPLLAGQDLLAPYALGIGGLVVADLSLKDTDPGPDDFGERVIVAWLSNDDLAAIRDALRAAGLPVTVGPGIPSPPPSSPSPPAGSPGGPGLPPAGTTTINTTVNNINLSGAGFGQTVDLSDDSGDEVLIFRDIGLASLNATMALVAGILASGTGTVRIYTGGTFEGIGSTGTPSGTLRDSAAVSGAGENTYDLDATFANPGGLVPIKITMQSSAPATAIGVSIIRGSLG
jgi:hypothetical protein